MGDFLKDKKRLYIICFIFLTIIGSLLHFAFDITNSTFVGLFTPVNESIWEHFKLVLVPSTLFVLILILLKKDVLNSSLLSFCLSFVSTCIFIYVYMLVYDYMGLEHTVISSILLYIISMAICFTLIYIFSTSSSFAGTNMLGIILLFMIYLLFIVLTLFPPELDIFKDSITGTYGIYP